VRITREERETALKAARLFGLKLAGVDLLRSDTGPKVLEVNSSPGLEGVETTTQKNVAGLLYEHVERHVRPIPLRRRSSR
jgi:ribosomal protein S6--L-glutamate ligase